MTKNRLQWGLLSTARINERLIPCLKKSNHNELLAIASRSRNVADHYAGHVTRTREVINFKCHLDEIDWLQMQKSIPWLKADPITPTQYTFGNLCASVVATARAQ